MPDLRFAIESAAAVSFAATPLVEFQMTATNGARNESIHTVILRAQIQIEAPQREYSADEEMSLRDLFGERSRWNDTLRGVLWTHASASVPAFDEEVRFSLPVPCSYDFNLAAAKYFHALRDGDVPISVYLSGTVFYARDGGPLQIAQISTDSRANFRFPVHIWKDMMDHYYPNSAVLTLDRDVFEELRRYKIANGIPTWEQTLKTLLGTEARRA